MSPLWLLAIVGWVVGGTWAYDTPHCDGRQTIVHLFEWKWTDIAAECERFLGPNEFCAVQVSPPMEHLVASSSGYPWWQRYQPISYKLESRSGNEGEFIDMVNRCNAVGVRIIVDAVVNHMTGIGQSGTGSGGSSFNADNRDFPGVPYGYNDFTPRDQCPSSDGQIHDYSNVNEVRNCMLVGLTDLYGGSDYVRQKVSEYFNHVIDIGVMGFRVDASKHMWPGDLEAIEGLTKDLNTDKGFPAGARPFFYHEVIDQGGEPITVQEYFGVGRTTEFRFGKKIAWGVNDFSQLGNIYDQGWGMAPSDKALNFVDNHDNQRGHGGAGDILTYKNGKDYTLGVCFSLAHDYGFMRIMSSYYFDNSDQGPPSGGGGSTSDVIINDDGTCGGGWVCEHRWNAITQMVRFRNAVAGTSIENWYQEGDNVAFSRGNKGFFAMTKYGNFDKTLQTGMPAGTYCELISHCANQVTVNGDGTAMISIHNEQEPVFAICVGCGDGPSPTVDPSHTTTLGPTLPPVPGTARTVIFIHKITSPGQDLFIRGGIDSQHRPGCTETAETDPCAITQETNSLGSETHYEKYNSWRVGDTKLDWFGAQPGQGTYSGQGAEGSPLAWTTNTPGAAGYQELNTFGEHYWMLDVQMNCEETEGGWFELKGYLTNGAGWETDISQVAKCAGDAGGSRPYTSTNHIGRCGYINVFEFSGNSCQVLSFPNES